VIEKRGGSLQVQVLPRSRSSSRGSPGQASGSTFAGNPPGGIAQGQGDHDHVVQGADHGQEPGLTKGPGSNAEGLAMAFKLLEAAQDRWRAVNGPQLVALVRTGARFDKGVMIERPDEVAA
jgi:hypothetical protein